MGNRKEDKGRLAIGLNLQDDLDCHPDQRPPGFVVCPRNEPTAFSNFILAAFARPPAAAELCAAQRGAAGFALCCTALWGAVGVAFLFVYTDARDQTGMHHDGLLFKIAYAALLAGTTTPVVAYGALRTVGRNRARAAAEQHTAVNDENDAGGSNLV